MAEKVIIWRTEDGSVFPTQEEAKLYEYELIFNEHYNTNPIYFQDTKVHLKTVREWLLQNKIAVLTLYGVGG